MKNASPLLKEISTDGKNLDVLPTRFKEPLNMQSMYRKKSTVTNIKTNSALQTIKKKNLATYTTKASNKFKIMKEHQYESEFYDQTSSDMSSKAKFLPNIKSKQETQQNSSKKEEVKNEIMPTVSNQSVEKLESQNMNSVHESQKNFHETSEVEKKDSKIVDDTNFVKPNLWHEIKPFGYKILRRSKHISFVYNDMLYIHGGYDFNSGVYNDMHRLVKTIENDESENYKWEIVVHGKEMMPHNKRSINKIDTYINTSTVFEKEYSESLSLVENLNETEKINTAPYLAKHMGTVYNNILYIYGGRGSVLKILNSMFSFNLETKEWRYLNGQIEVDTVSNKTRLPSIDSHSMNLYDGECYIFGGFKGNKNMGYSNCAYKFSIDDLEFTE